VGITIKMANPRLPVERPPIVSRLNAKEFVSAKKMAETVKSYSEELLAQMREEV
jgi:hypothetical protein